MKALTLATTLAAACLVAPVAAQTLKPGLWEMQQKMHGSPEMDQAMAEMRKEMANMPPEQRKQMEAMMARQGVQVAPGAGGATAVRVCMTKEQVERNEIQLQQGDCRTTQQQRSGNTLKVSFTCGNPPMRGESQVTFASPESFTSRTTLSGAGAGKQDTTIEGTGKWLAADCGNVKPLATPPKK